MLRDAERKHSFVPLVVRANLSWEEMARIEVAVPDLPGVAIEQGMIRHYPYGRRRAHVLGYVARGVGEGADRRPAAANCPISGSARAGSRKSQDLQLRGTAGTSRGRGQRLSAGWCASSPIAPGQPGEDVVLGLDLAMQDFVDAALRRRAEHLVRACSTRATGDVLALVSSPAYDPMLFSTGLTQAVWQELSTDPRNPLTNKAIAGVYPPGSTFKPMVALAALEAGVDHPEHRGHLPRLSRARQRHLPLLEEGRPRHAATARRDQAVLRRLLLRDRRGGIGIDRIAAMARRFGFGAPLGIDMPGERAGLIPTRDWKQATTGTTWQQGETLIAGIGQGSVLATPLQLAMMAARLATGRAVVPHLVRRDGRLPPGGDQRLPDFAGARSQPARISRSCSTA